MTISNIMTLIAALLTDPANAIVAARISSKPALAVAIAPLYALKQVVTAFGATSDAQILTAAGAITQYPAAVLGLGAADTAIGDLVQPMLWQPDITIILISQYAADATTASASLWPYLDALRALFNAEGLDLGISASGQVRAQPAGYQPIALDDVMPGYSAYAFRLQITDGERSC